MQLKRIGKIILTYFEELTVFSLVTMFVYMYTQLSYEVVSASRGPFFHLGYFIEGFMYFFPLVAIGTLLCAMFYLIRHEHTFSEAFIGFSLLSALVWLVIVPLWLIHFSQYRFIVLFREYKDPSLSQIISVPVVFHFLVERFSIIHQIGFQIAAKGYLKMLILLPFGIAISCLPFISVFSSWRLINFFSVIGMFLLIVISNSYLFDPRFLSSMDLLSDMGYWLPFFFNLIATVICISIGIISHAVRHGNPNREAD